MEQALTEAMKRDLLKCFRVWKKTRGTYDYPSGQASRLRTGEALAERGLVVRANTYSANMYKNWLPTDAGKKVVGEFILVKEFTTTAALYQTHYRHFGIHEKSASLYGDKVEDIVQIKMSIAADQTVPKQPNKSADYWGWFDFEEERFVFIWPSYLQLSMCFTYGMKAEEDRGRGKAYRLEIIP